ncbi:hypothetical protein ABT373_32955 [Streptomyces sp. NPDC000070]|uniref:hypothetical protein n=1 Tax=Streptomyces sp. NPDC000070 TaxID=3154240 RepID=UPI00332C100A
MGTREGNLHRLGMRGGDRIRPPVRLPFIIPVLALGMFLAGVTEFAVRRLLPAFAGDLRGCVVLAGVPIVFLAVGMIVSP